MHTLGMEEHRVDAMELTDETTRRLNSRHKSDILRLTMTIKKTVCQSTGAPSVDETGGPSRAEFQARV